MITKAKIDSSQPRAAGLALILLLGLFLALFLTLFLALTPENADAQTQRSQTVDFVELQGVIDPVTARFLLRQIHQAEIDGSAAVIVRLDTPGGLDVSMREIVREILGAKVPVVVWVAPSGARAGSAGVFITMAAHVAVMSPGTNIGAAHPVDLGGDLGEVESQKAANDAAAFLRAIAMQRGRDAEWAEKAVTESASIDAAQAARLGVIDFVANSSADLFAQLRKAEVEIDGERRPVLSGPPQLRFHKMRLLESLLHSALRPEVAYLLLLLGFYALIFELYNPGIGAAGVLGGVALIFGFYSLSVLPASWAAVALIVLAVAFFLVDLHVAGLGVFTVGGTVALLGGSLLLFAGADPFFRLPIWVVIGAVAVTALFFLSVMTAALRARMAKPISGAEGIVGTLGTARTDISPEGQVMAKGTLWRARTAGAAIAQGSPVEVLGVSGLVLIVQPPKH